MSTSHTRPLPNACAVPRLISAASPASARLSSSTAAASAATLPAATSASVTPKPVTASASVSAPLTTPATVVVAPTAATPAATTASSSAFAPAANIATAVTPSPSIATASVPLSSTTASASKSSPPSILETAAHSTALPKTPASSEPNSAPTAAPATVSKSPTTISVATAPKPVSAPAPAAATTPALSAKPSAPPKLNVVPIRPSVIPNVSISPTTAAATAAAAAVAVASTRQPAGPSPPLRRAPTPVASKALPPPPKPAPRPPVATAATAPSPSTAANSAPRDARPVAAPAELPAEAGTDAALKAEPTISSPAAELVTRSQSIVARGESISLARRAAATAKRRREEARAELERRGVRDGVDSALAHIVGMSAATRANVSQNKAKRSKRIKWTDEEVNALRDGVVKYGQGRWAVILREFASMFNPIRISVDLKDKWRNLSKAQRHEPPPACGPEGKHDGDERLTTSAQTSSAAPSGSLAASDASRSLAGASPALGYPGSSASPVHPAHDVVVQQGVHLSLSNPAHDPHAIQPLHPSNNNCMVQQGSHAAFSSSIQAPKNAAREAAHAAAHLEPLVEPATRHADVPPNRSIYEHAAAQPDNDAAMTEADQYQHQHETAPHLHHEHVEHVEYIQSHANDHEQHYEEGDVAHAEAEEGAVHEVEAGTHDTDAHGHREGHHVHVVHSRVQGVEEGTDEVVDEAAHSSTHVYVHEEGPADEHSVGLVEHVAEGNEHLKGQAHVEENNIDVHVQIHVHPEVAHEHGVHEQDVHQHEVHHHEAQHEHVQQLQSHHEEVHEQDGHHHEVHHHDVHEQAVHEGAIHHLNVHHQVLDQDGVHEQDIGHHSNLRHEDIHHDHAHHHVHNGVEHEGAHHETVHNEGVHDQEVHHEAVHRGGVHHREVHHESGHSVDGNYVEGHHLHGHHVEEHHVEEHHVEEHHVEEHHVEEHHVEEHHVEGHHVEGHHVEGRQRHVEEHHVDGHHVEEHLEGHHVEENHDTGHHDEEHHEEGHHAEGHHVEEHHLHHVERHHDEGHHVEGHHVEGHHVEGHHVEGHHVEGHHVDGHHVEEHHVEEHHVEGQHVEGQHIEGHLVEGHLVEGHLVEEHHVEEHHVEGHHVEGHHVEGHHVEGHHVEGHHMEEHHVEGHHEEGHHEEGHHGEGHHEEGHHVEDRHVEGHHLEGHLEEGHHEEGQYEDGHHQVHSHNIHHEGLDEQVEHHQGIIQTEVHEHRAHEQNVPGSVVNQASIHEESGHQQSDQEPDVHRPEGHQTNVHHGDMPEGGVSHQIERIVDDGYQEELHHNTNHSQEPTYAVSTGGCSSPHVKSAHHEAEHIHSFPEQERLQRQAHQSAHHEGSDLAHNLQLASGTDGSAVVRSDEPKDNMNYAGQGGEGGGENLTIQVEPKHEAHEAVHSYAAECGNSKSVNGSSPAASEHQVHVYARQSPHAEHLQSQSEHTGTRQANAYSESEYPVNVQIEGDASNEAYMRHSSKFRTRSETNSRASPVNDADRAVQVAENPISQQYQVVQVCEAHPQGERDYDTGENDAPSAQVQEHYNREASGGQHVTDDAFNEGHVAGQGSETALRHASNPDSLTQEVHVETQVLTHHDVNRHEGSGANVIEHHTESRHLHGDGSESGHRTGEMGPSHLDGEAGHVHHAEEAVNVHLDGGTGHLHSEEAGHVVHSEEVGQGHHAAEVERGHHAAEVNTVHHEEEAGHGHLVSETVHVYRSEEAEHMCAVAETELVHDAEEARHVHGAEEVGLVSHIDESGHVHYTESGHHLNHPENVHHDEEERHILHGDGIERINGTHDGKNEQETVELRHHALDATHVHQNAEAEHGHHEVGKRDFIHSTNEANRGSHEAELAGKHDHVYVEEHGTNIPYDAAVTPGRVVDPIILEDDLETSDRNSEQMEGFRSSQDAAYVIATDGTPANELREQALHEVANGSNHDVKQESYSYNENRPVNDTGGDGQGYVGTHIDGVAPFVPVHEVESLKASQAIVVHQEFESSIGDVRPKPMTVSADEATASRYQTEGLHVAEKGSTGFENAEGHYETQATYVEQPEQYIDQSAVPVPTQSYARVGGSDTYNFSDACDDASHSALNSHAHGLEQVVSDAPAATQRGSLPLNSEIHRASQEVHEPIDQFPDSQRHRFTPQDAQVEDENMTTVNSEHVEVESESKHLETSQGMHVDVHVGHSVADGQVNRSVEEQDSEGLIATIVSEESQVPTERYEERMEGDFIGYGVVVGSSVDSRRVAVEEAEEAGTALVITSGGAAVGCRKAEGDAIRVNGKVAESILKEEQTERASDFVEGNDDKSMKDGNGDVTCESGGDPIRDGTEKNEDIDASVAGTVCDVTVEVGRGLLKGLSTDDVEEHSDAEIVGRNGELVVSVDVSGISSAAMIEDQNGEARDVHESHAGKRKREGVDGNGAVGNGENVGLVASEVRKRSRVCDDMKETLA